MAMEKEIAKLKAENELIKKVFSDAVKTKVEGLAKTLVAEKQKTEAKRDRALCIAVYSLLKWIRRYDYFRSRRMASGSA